MDNEMSIEFFSCSENESFARVVIAAFAAQLDPTLEEIADIKTAVSEAVTNSVIHAYANSEGIIRMKASYHDRELKVSVIDEGLGIADINQAMEPFYTTKPELERSGMGFAFMIAFMDEVKVESAPGVGTSVHMRKVLT